MNREFPMYRNDPLYWEPFWENFCVFVKQEFSGMKVGRDVIAAITTAAITDAPLIWLTSPDRWLQHPLWIVCLVLINAAAGVLGPCLLRVGVALWKTFRRPRFRGYGLVSIFGVVALSLWGLGFWYDDYVRSPHLKLSIGWIMVFGTPNQGTHVQRVVLLGVDKDHPQPNTLIVFANIVLTNSGVTSKARNWRLIVKPPHGGQVFGDRQVQDGDIRNPATGQPTLTFTLQENIFYKTENKLIDGQPISGKAPFIVEGMMNAVAAQPGTVYEVHCDDDKGRTYSATYIVPSTGQPL